jgi:hypothetical protein
VSRSFSSDVVDITMHTNKIPAIRNNALASTVNMNIGRVTKFQIDNLILTDLLNPVFEVETDVLEIVRA